MESIAGEAGVPGPRCIGGSDKADLVTAAIATKAVVSSR